MLCEASCWCPLVLRSLPAAAASECACREGMDQFPAGAAQPGSVVVVLGERGQQVKAEKRNPKYQCKKTGLHKGSKTR